MRYFLYANRTHEVRGTYLLTEEDAKEIYIDLGKQNLIQDCELMFREGHAFIDGRGNIIWGEFIDEKELFEKLLSGEIHKMPITVKDVKNVQ